MFPQPEAVIPQEEATGAGDGVVPDSAKESGRALRQDGHLRGSCRWQETNW